MFIHRSRQADHLELGNHANDVLWIATVTDSPMSNISQVSLDQMPHKAYLRRSWEDWAGITNQKERKKLQNRLNQRAGE